MRQPELRQCLSDRPRLVLFLDVHHVVDDRPLGVSVRAFLLYFRLLTTSTDAT